MGSAQGDYHQQMTQALDQANKPKSDLAKAMSSSLGGMYGGAIQQMTTGLGNSFPGFTSGAGTPGQVFNGGGVNPFGNMFAPQPYQQPQQPQQTDMGRIFEQLGRFGLNSNQNQQAPSGSYLGSDGQMYQPNGQVYNQVASFQQQPQSPLDPNRKTWNMNDPRTQQQILDQDFGGDQYAFMAASPNESVARMASNPQLMNAMKQGYNIGSDGSLIDSSGKTVAGPNPEFASLIGNVSANSQVDPLNGTGGVHGVGGNGQMIPGSQESYLQGGIQRDAAGNIIQNYNQPQGNFNRSLGGLGQFDASGSGGNGFQSANPFLQAMNLQGPNNQALAQLMQQIQNPGVSNYNPSAGLLGSGLANQTYSPMNVGLSGLAQALQQQLGSLGQNQNSLMSQQFQNANVGNVPQVNAGGANLPQLNLGDPNLQAAQGREVNAPNAQLNLAQAQNVQPGQFNPMLANIDQSSINPQDSQFYQAVQNTLNQQLDLGRKDLRARFGASGGTSRGTPAAYAEAQFNAQALPQMAQALGGVRQQEFTNQLAQRQLGQEGNLQNAGLANQYGLAGNQLNVNTQLANIQNQLQAANQGNSALLQARGQDINNNQQNVQNLLQAAGLNNQSNLQARQQNLDLLGLGQQGALQNQGLINQAGMANQEAALQGRQQDIGNQQGTNQLNLQRMIAGSGQGVDSFNALSNLYNQNQSQQLQSYFNTIGANQNQLGILGNLAQQAGNQNMQQQQLGSQNYFQAAGQNSQNANSLLSQMLGYQTNQNQAQLGQNQLLAGLSQFNAGQGNDITRQLLQQQQAGNEAQIGRQYTALQNLLQLAGQFGLAGIPGGSANVNLGATSQSPIQQTSGLLGSLGSLF